MTYLPSFEDAQAALQYPLAEATVRATSRSGLARRLSSIRGRILGIIESVAEHYVASAIYEALSRLSDDELRRRGLSRGNLACDVRAICRRDRARQRARDRGQARAR